MEEPIGSFIREREVPAEGTSSPSTTDKSVKPANWPVGQDRQRLKWFPARQRLISLVRGSQDAFVLPPAVIRKASWRE